MGQLDGESGIMGQQDEKKEERYGSAWKKERSDRVRDMGQQ